MWEKQPVRCWLSVGVSWSGWIRIPQISLRRTRIESSGAKEVFLQVITAGSDAFTDRAARARC